MGTMVQEETPGPLVAPATLVRLNRLRAIAHEVLNQNPGMTYADAIRAAREVAPRLRA